jgi:hypothetical protein
MSTEADLNASKLIPKPANEESSYDVRNGNDTELLPDFYGLHVPSMVEMERQHLFNRTLHSSRHCDQDD